jgi:hypothetical protein
MRADFAARVDTMSALELQAVIADLDAKFRILATPQLQETRAWFGWYLSLLTDRRRDEILREIPDFPTMTAAQLQQAILKIQRKQSARASANRNSRARNDARIQSHQANLAAQTAARERSAQRTTERSPYRPATQERPFDDVQIGPSRSMSVGPNGGIWLNMGF